MPQVRWKRGLVLSALVLAVFSGLTWLAVEFNFDFRVGHLFFRENGGWVYRDDQPWKLLYQYGTVPGLVLTLACLAVFFLGFVKPRLRSYQRYMLLVVLTAVLGAGLLVNGILKPYCGRPRPREVKQFGGQWEYCLPCQPDRPIQGNSFPCGHCTMGFLFVSLVFLWPKNRAVALGGTAFGLFYGTLMSLTRAVQGAHFATDDLWSLGAILLVALLLNDIVLPLIERSLILSRDLSRRQLWLSGLCMALIAAAITLVFLTRRPYANNASTDLKVPAQTRLVVIQSNVAFTRRITTYSRRPARLSVLARGFGWFNAQEDLNFKSSYADQRLTISITAKPRNYFSELHHEISLRLPQALKDRVQVEFTPARP